MNPELIIPILQGFIKSKKGETLPELAITSIPNLSLFEKNCCKTGFPSLRKTLD